MKTLFLYMLVAAGFAVILACASDDGTSSNENCSFTSDVNSVVSTLRGVCTKTTDMVTVVVVDGGTSASFFINRVNNSYGRTGTTGNTTGTVTVSADEKTWRYVETGQPETFTIVLD